MTERPRKAFAALLAFVLACLFIAPATAFAEERAVDVENHTVTQGWKETVSDVRIDGVDAPTAGKVLDDKAQVSTVEGKEWDIPVLWVRDDLAIMPEPGEAAEGHAYLPVLAFFVPDDYALTGPGYKVTLAEELTALFGTDEIISVYSEESGITYILSASLKDLFVRTASAPSAAGGTSSNTEDVIAETVQPTLVDSYCAQTARDALSDDDLEWLSTS